MKLINVSLSEFNQAPFFNRLLHSNLIQCNFLSNEIELHSFAYQLGISKFVLRDSSRLKEYHLTECKDVRLSLKYETIKHTT